MCRIFYLIHHFTWLCKWTKRNALKSNASRWYTVFFSIAIKAAWHISYNSNCNKSHLKTSCTRYLSAKWQPRLIALTRQYTGRRCCRKTDDLFEVFHVLLATENKVFAAQEFVRPMLQFFRSVFFNYLLNCVIYFFSPTIIMQLISRMD